VPSVLWINPTHSPRSVRRQLTGAAVRIRRGRRTATVRLTIRSAATSWDALKHGKSRSRPVASVAEPQPPVAPPVDPARAEAHHVVQLPAALLPVALHRAAALHSRTVRFRERGSSDRHWRPGNESDRVSAVPTSRVGCTNRCPRMSGLFVDRSLSRFCRAAFLF
jgi:hypothetical protein